MAVDARDDLRLKMRLVARGVGERIGQAQCLEADVPIVLRRDEYIWLLSILAGTVHAVADLLDEREAADAGDGRH